MRGDVRCVHGTGKTSAPQSNTLRNMMVGNTSKAVQVDDTIKGAHTMGFVDKKELGQHMNKPLEVRSFSGAVGRMYEGSRFIIIIV